MLAILKNDVWKFYEKESSFVVGTMPYLATYMYQKC